MKPNGEAHETVRSHALNGPSITDPAKELGGVSMPRALAALENILCQELDCYRDLLDIMLREKHVLTANRPELLPELIEAQKRVLLDAREIEPRRIEAMRALGACLGVEETPTLRLLTEHLTGDDRTRVEKLREALAHVVPRVDKVNRVNVLLIRNSMSFISSTVRAILEESTPRSPTYAASGETRQQGEVSAWTDRRA